VTLPFEMVMETRSRPKRPRLEAEMSALQSGTWASLIDFICISACKNDNSRHINTIYGGVGKLASTRYTHTLAVDSAQTFRMVLSEVKGPVVDGGLWYPYSCIYVREVAEYIGIGDRLGGELSILGGSA
jgi:hypothetical protein